jgi:hypothetical protein
MHQVQTCKKYTAVAYLDQQNAMAPGWMEDANFAHKLIQMLWSYSIP